MPRRMIFIILFKFNGFNDLCEMQDNISQQKWLFTANLQPHYWLFTANLQPIYVAAALSKVCGGRLSMLRIPNQANKGTQIKAEINTAKFKPKLKP